MSVSIPLAAGPRRLTTEASLFHQAQAGCRDSLDRLMATHDGLVQAVVRRQVLGQLPFAEVVQAGRLGLWRTLLGYDPQRGGAFATYDWPAIQRQIWRAVQVYHRPRAPPPARAAPSARTRPRSGQRSTGKRLPVYGEPRGRAWICLADTWSTLTTLARLVREATHATHFI